MSWFSAPLTRRGLGGFFGLSALGCFCGRAHSQQPAEQGGSVPGAPTSTKSKVLSMGADMLQKQSPISAISMYLDGFHFYADDMGRQIEGHHYCTHVNEEFIQCVIYDGNQSNARLIGIEYIVSERIFRSLPEDEKRLWHSHRHETTSGELVMPGIPQMVEHQAIEMLVTTYGKTWHTWQVDRDSTLPLGIPQLMMGFTADGQLKKELLADRDQRLDVSSPDKKENRADLRQQNRPTVPGADSWQSGRVRQLTLAEVGVKNRPG